MPWTTQASGGSTVVLDPPAPSGDVQQTVPELRSGLASPSIDIVPWPKYTSPTAESHSSDSALSPMKSDLLADDQRLGSPTAASLVPDDLGSREPRPVDHKEHESLENAERKGIDGRDLKRSKSEGNGSGPEVDSKCPGAVETPRGAPPIPCLPSGAEPWAEVWLENEKGTLPGSSQAEVAVLLTPHQRMTCRLQVGLMIGNSSPDGKDSTTVLPLSVITANVVYPRVTVTDVARAGLPKSWAEQQASVVDLNALLGSDQSKVNRGRPFYGTCECGEGGACARGAPPHLQAFVNPDSPQNLNFRLYLINTFQIRRHHSEA